MRGGHIDLSVSASISSPVIAQWAAALWARHGQTRVNQYDGIVGHQLTYLTPAREDVPLSWELAQAHSRAAAIAHVIDCITRHALPWFAHCDDVPRLIEHIAETGEYPVTYPRSRLPGSFPAGFMLAFATREQTIRALAVYINRLHSSGRANLYKDIAAARAQSPLQLARPWIFHGCDVRVLLAEGIEFPGQG
jgi:hypothetical protein